MTNGLNSYALLRITIAGMWFYQGLVPKLLGPHADELAMDLALGLTLQQAHWMAYAAGASEIIMGALMLLCWRQRWPLQLTIVAMLGLLVYVMVMTPQFLVGAFNPIIMNLAIAVMAIVALRLHGSTYDNIKT